MKFTSTLLFGLLLMSSILFLNFQKKSTLFFQLTNNEALPFTQKEAAGWYKMKDNANLTFDELLSRYHADLGLTQWDELKLYRSETDDLGMTHRRLQQYHRSIPVEFGELLVHEKNGFVQTFNGEWVGNLDLNTSPNISEEEAIELAKEEQPAEKYLWEDAGAEQMIKRVKRNEEATFFPKPELVWLKTEDIFNNVNYRLAYKMEIQGAVPLFRQQVYIDAIDESVLLNLEMMHTGDVNGFAETKYSGGQVMVTDSIAADSFRLREYSHGQGIETYDMNQGTDYSAAVDFFDADNYWDNINNEQDEAATDAHWGAQATFDYLETKHNYSSYDGEGGLMISYIHYDENWLNASWNGVWAQFGDGTGAAWSALTGLDVVAHEFAHGITDANANLIYQNESGALNESFSDIFGAAVEFWATPDQADWFIGEDFNTNGNGFRSMANPKSMGDPDTYGGTNWFTGTDDNGGVHTNSGVQNYWYYLLVEGGAGFNDNFQQFLVQPLGLDTATTIAFRNLRFYLTESSDYVDARQGSLQSAEDLYGICSVPVGIVQDAWFAVGLGFGFSPNDLKVFEIIDPIGLNCGLADSLYPTFQFRYNGCGEPIDSATKLPIALQVNDGPIVIDSIELDAAFFPGDTLSYTFNTPATGLETAGTHSLQLWTDYVFDVFLRNDTAQVEIINLIEQSSDFAGEEIHNPNSACFITEEFVEVEIEFLGCDSIPAGTELAVSYSLNGATPVTETIDLENTLFYEDTYNYTFSTAVDFSNNLGLNIIEAWVNFSADFLNDNDDLPIELIVNPKLMIEDKVLTFEEGLTSADSFYVQVNANSGVLISGDAANTGDLGLQLRGGDSFTAFFAGELEVPGEENHWEVNESFGAKMCICVNASEMETADLSFDLKQTNSPVYELQFGVSLPYASCFRVLVNDEPITDTYTPNTAFLDPYETHVLNLDNWAGSNFEVCFETRNLLSFEIDPLGTGDNTFLDNIVIGADIVSTDEVSTKFSGLTIFPNPNSGNFNLSWESEIAGNIEIEIFDLTGKLLQKQNLNGQNNLEISLENMAKGAYFLKISDGVASTFERIVVQ